MRAPSPRPAVNISPCSRSRTRRIARESRRSLMYIPSHFRESDERVLAEFIGAYAFGTLVTVERGLPFASHLPFLHDREGRTLHAHVARGNPQWQHVTDNPD